MCSSLLALFLLAAAPLQAQQTPGTHIGIGVRVNELLSDLFTAPSFANTFGGGGVTILVPVNVGTSFRIEPEIGFGRTSNDSGERNFRFEQTVTRYRVGLGLMKLVPSGDFSLYAGGRVSYTRIEQTFESDFDDEVEQTGSIFGIGPVVGGEHYFSPRFSLGGEAGLLYQSLGSAEVDGEENDAGFSALATTGAVYVRFYFN